MPKLRFFAARDALVHERNEDGSSMMRTVGAAERYVGRKHDINLRGYPATEEPYECNEGTPEAAYLIRECKVGDLHPADEYTAKACGVELPDLAFNEGVWVVKAKASAPTPPTTPPVTPPTTPDDGDRPVAEIGGAVHAQTDSAAGAQESA